MNENLNLVEILKDCPSGTKLYSPVSGEVNFVIVNIGDEYPIKVEAEYAIYSFTSQGKLNNMSQGECLLFPSREQRDWSKFKPKFDPKTLQPFDRVLVRDYSSIRWKTQLFSHIIKYEKDCPYSCTDNSHKYCIPYNDDTKHLVGTTEEAPEFYRYWED